MSDQRYWAVVYTWMPHYPGYPSPMPPDYTGPMTWSWGGNMNQEALTINDINGWAQLGEQYWRLVYIWLNGSWWPSPMYAPGQRVMIVLPR